MTGPDQRPQFDPRDIELLRRAGESRHPDLPSPELDLATARLYSHLLRQPMNRTFLDAALANPAMLPGGPLVIGIVPGAFHRHHKNTGADGARVAGILQNLGIRTEIIPVHSFGRLEANAAIIRDWLRKQQAGRVALITLSKGGADCKTALRSSALAEWERVVAWINLSGLVQGTPLVAWLRRQKLRMIGVRLLLWFQGQDFAAADDLQHGDSAALAAWPELPPQMRLIHVIAFPLRRHLRHPWARRAYERLAPLGPNDGGGILLKDALALPGVVCPVWGADHYLEPAWDATPFLRNVILASLIPTPEPLQANVSAASPITAPAIRSTK